MIGLFLDGELIELVDDPADVEAYLGVCSDLIVAGETSSILRSGG